jgi:DNA-binding SARP family transcriptional activator
LQVYVANLRRALEPDRAPGSPPTLLLTSDGGYSLAVDPDQVDAACLEQAFSRARGDVESQRLDDAIRRLRTALDESRGAPLAGLEQLPIHDRFATGLQELRLDALELCYAAELEVGLAGSLVAELEAVVREAPYRERFRVLLIRALYASGRQRDALAAFQDARQTLLEDLGVDPGPGLREVERQVLEQDRGLDIVARPRPSLRSHADEVVVRRRVSVVAASGSAVDSELLTAAARRHGGTVADRSEESMVVAFGVRGPGLDDAEHAADLARELQQERLSVGVATGFASTTAGTVSGAPVGRAVDLSGRAGPGGLLIDAATREILGGRASVEPTADAAFALLGLTSRSPGTDGRGPLFGRDGELELLASAWRVAARMGRPAVVTLLGAPGTGTSRLAAEAADGADASVVRIELHPAVAPEEVLAMLESGPPRSLVVLEDVHRAPRIAASALGRWAEVAADGPFLCIATATPDLQSAHPTWPGQLPLALTLEVPPLDLEAATRLAGHVLGDDVPGSRAATVAAIAGGNPLFVIELARQVAAGGPPPHRLEALVAARVDESSPSVRRALEVIAVLGGRAVAGELEELWGEGPRAIDELVSTALVTVDDEGCLAMHEVVAGVVLESMPDDRFVAVHERAAATAATLTARAAHHEQAAARLGDTVPNDAAVAAVDALCELAWRAWSRSDVETAVDALHRASAVCLDPRIDLVSRVRSSRRRLASELVAGRLATPRVDAPVRVPVAAWDASWPAERELIDAARSLRASMKEAGVRDRCDAVVASLSIAEDHGRSASSSS